MFSKYVIVHNINFISVRVFITHNLAHLVANRFTDWAVGTGWIFRMLQVDGTIMLGDVTVATLSDIYIDLQTSGRASLGEEN